MDLDWFPASIIIGVTFYCAFLIYDAMGLLDDSWMNSMFGMAFLLGALIVIVMLCKPLFFPSREIPLQ